MKLVSIATCIGLLCALSIHGIKTNTDDAYSISMQPCWKCLDDGSPGSCKQFGGKWVLVGNITFKKRSLKDSLYLQQLTLMWHGPHINQLSASLYKKNFDPTKKEFLPIDEYLVCDGMWNKAKQALILTFDAKQTVGALEVFYLVLTVPDGLEYILQQGSFHLQTSDLPNTVAQKQESLPLQLTFNSTRR